MSVRKINIREVSTMPAPSRVIAELISGKRLGARGSALRVVEILPAVPGRPRHPHTHLTYEEAIYVEHGRGKIWVDHAVTDIRPGDAILIPPGTKHMIKNTGPGPMRLICAFSTADPDGQRIEHEEIDFPEEPAPVTGEGG
ncbi:MAG: cupin domain-containing protein [Deltaproteobacteria bacterium]|nr:cupin domain-containing protein [Deltaproteobacteria bacterium]